MKRGPNWSFQKAEYQKRYRAKHIEACILRGRKFSDANRKAWFQRIDALRQGPCTDCGQTFHPASMEFDHVPERGAVVNRISGMSNCSKETQDAELAKCDLVCANCHCVRTFNRKQSGYAQKVTLRSS